MRVEANPSAIEGMAAWGLISDVKVERCKDGKARVIAYPKNGGELATKCMEEDAARRVATLIRLYIKNWSKLIVGSQTPA